MAIIRSLLVITTLAMTALLAAIYAVGPGLLENAQNKVAGDMVQLRLPRRSNYTHL